MEVNYKGKNKYYNTSKKPIRQPKILTFLLYLISKISLIGKEYKIEKIGMEGLKPPYILLSNHHHFIDFELSAIATFPHRVNNIATIDGYYRRPLLMELLGCICKRKFTNDLSLIRSIRLVLNRGDVLEMYPEARYSPVGTTAILPDSLGKLIKLNKVPVAVLLHHGNYLHTPFWNYRNPRKVPLYTTLTKVLSKEDSEKLSVEEINEKIRLALSYDEYKWQKEQKIKIDEPFRAEGLHKVLYQCPACKAEHKMNSKGTELFCESCGKVWIMTEYGELRAMTGETEFSHIPSWYEWQREMVRKEILRGEYSFRDEVEIYSLPKCMKFENLGKGELIHDPENGFVLKGNYRDSDFVVERKPKGMYGLHVEYDYCYIKPFDCIDISTEKDSFYCYPKKQNVVTKLSIATEEIYKIKTADKVVKKSGE